MSGKIFFRGLIPDLTFGLGLALLIIGIFMLKQPQVQIKAENTPSQEIQYSQGLQLNYHHISDKREKVEVVIPRGSSGVEVGAILDEEGLMDFKEFEKLIDLFQFQGKIKAGHYVFDRNTSSGEILTRILLD